MHGGARTPSARSARGPPAGSSSRARLTSAAPAGLTCSVMGRRREGAAPDPGCPPPALLSPLHAVVGEPEEPHFLPPCSYPCSPACACARCSRCRGLDRCRHRCGRPRPAASSSLSHHAAQREHHHPNRHCRVSSSSRVVSAALAHKQAHIGAALGEAAVHAAAPGVEKSRELGGRGRQGCGGGSSGRGSDH